MALNNISLNKKKKVDFVVDWKKEQTRSLKGAESRRLRKLRKMNGIEQEHEKMKAALEIIRLEAYVTSLKELPLYVRLVVFGVMNDGVAVERAVNDVEFESKLQQFRNDNTKARVELLTPQEQQMLKEVVGLQGFIDKFRDVIPSTVISSAESTP